MEVPNIMTSGNAPLIPAPLAILTADETRMAEQAIFARGVAVIDLMELAGKQVADAICRYRPIKEALVLCGPGNNGGDGYVVARLLRERGWPVRVAATGAPKTEAATLARERWNGPVEPLETAQPAALLVDGLFGTGLTRALDDMTQQRLRDLAAAARFRVAIDVPSGIGSDDGAVFGQVPHFHLTIALGCLKPGHLLQPGAHLCGAVRVGEIGLGGASQLHSLRQPRLITPGPGSYKYKRGYALIFGGDMAGASALAAMAASRSGAGYIRLVTPTPAPLALPHAIVRTVDDSADHWLKDERLNAVLIGPGLGRDEAARCWLDQILASPRPLVLDADALMLMSAHDLDGLASRHAPVILTPHEGEFNHLFGKLPGSKVERTRAAAARAGSVVVLKGADSVIAAPDGRAVIAPDASHWLSTAGTGDVLAGLTAGLLATGLDAFEAACAAQYLHGEAARIAGPLLIADDLIAALPRAYAACLTE